MHSVLMSYKAALQSQQIVLSLVEKSSNRRMFHNTLFFAQSPDGVRSLMVATNADLDNVFIVLLVSTFEHILFNHPNSPVSESQRERGLAAAITSFKSKVSPRIYEAADELRRYRDWVAHGKRWQSDPDHPLAYPAGPEIVCSQLTEFLSQSSLKPVTSSISL
ncbi:MAG: hypothetical protein M3Z35_17750 [Nitrospirota bacterium]|nr:hypothetical protein [Nitrospirota bacterium]